MRLGLIGAGRHAKDVLIPSIYFVKEIEVVCLATGHEESASKLQKATRIKCYSGYEKVLKEDVDGVIIAAPTPMHHQIAIEAMKAGKHVLCETPALTSQDGAEKIRKTIQETGRLYQVAWPRRYAPIYVQFKKTLSEVNLNPADTLLSIRYYSAYHHFLNLAQGLAGGMEGLSARKSGPHTTLLVDFRNGSKGCLIASALDSWYPPYERVEVAAASWLISAQDCRELTVYRNLKKEHPLDIRFDSAHAESWSPSGTLLGGRMNSFYLRGYIPEIESFVRSVRDGESLETDLDDALESLRVRQAVERSLAGSGKPQKIT